MSELRPSDRMLLLRSLIGVPILLPFALIVVLYIWFTGYGNARS